MIETSYMSQTATHKQSDYKQSSKKRLTINGFTPEFEQHILDSEKEPIQNARTWNGKGSFTAFVLRDAPRMQKKGK